MAQPAPDVTQFVIDPWSPLSHKWVIGDGWQRSSIAFAPSWVGPHWRRLAAYRVLSAYIENISRNFLSAETITERKEHREYGDAGLLRDTVLAGILGDDQTIVVEGADDYDPNCGTDDEPQDDPSAVPGPVAGLLGADGQPVKPKGPSAEELAANDEAKRRADRQDWLQAWASVTTGERFKFKMIETERNAVGLGDGVYVLGWNATEKCPSLRVFDPGFYFPVLNPDGDDGEFPERVHIAWEVADDGEGNYVQVDPAAPPQAGQLRSVTAPKVHRITYELVERSTVFDVNGNPLEASVRYAYQDPADEPSTKVCVMTDGIYQLKSTRDPDSFDGQVEFLRNDEGYELNRLPLEIDFIPVVHLPNTTSVSQHFGVSSLSRVAQLVDDIAGADTDLASAVALTGTPALALSGVSSETNISTYGPGQLFKLGVDGKMTVLDLAAGLAPIQNYITDMLRRMAINSRLPEEVLGRVRSATIPSGVALALTFGPMEAMINEMRLVRDDKYGLLFKFIQRFAIQAGELDDAVVYPANLAFGSFLPSDTQAAVTQATALLAAKAISRQTAVAMLVEAGLPIDQAPEEVERIQEEDFAGAVQLLDATGDEQAVRTYLGLEGPGPRPAVLPRPTPAGGAPAPVPGSGGPAPAHAPPQPPPAR